MTDEQKKLLSKLFDFMARGLNGSLRQPIEWYGKRKAMSKWWFDLGGTIVTVVSLMLTNGEYYYIIRTSQWEASEEERLTSGGVVFKTLKGSEEAFVRDMIYVKMLLVDYD
jgi:hypothetical protein